MTPAFLIAAQTIVFEEFNAFAISQSGHSQSVRIIEDVYSSTEVNTTSSENNTSFKMFGASLS